MQPLMNQPASVGYNTAHAKREAGFCLAQAIAWHARLEAICDDAIQKQDNLIRSLARQRRDARERNDGENPHSAHPTPFSSASSAFLMTNAPFLQTIDDQEEAIESLETEIAQLQQAMRKVESAITKHSPRTPMDIARTVKFLSGVLADGGEVDMDAFRQLAETCADMLIEARAEIGLL